MVEVGAILDSWMYYIGQVRRNAFIVTYGCHLGGGRDDVDPVLSHEHKQVGLFAEAEVGRPRSRYPRTDLRSRSRTARAVTWSCIQAGVTMSAVTGTSWA